MMKPQTYQPSTTLDTSKIQEEVYNLLKKRHCHDFRQEINFLLDSFTNLIYSARVIGGYDGMYSVYHDEMRQSIATIKKCINKYMSGDILSSYNTFYRRWNRIWKSYDAFLAREQDYKHILYKIRVCDSLTINKKEIFHVPFNMREAIKNNRYSIAGYPCLYLGESLYTCWEELDRPDVYRSYASSFAFSKKVSLLDMRISQDIYSAKKEWAFLMILPFIIASSVKTIDTDAIFKPEYIIPQMFMHSILKTKKKARDAFAYDGIIYNSTKIRNCHTDIRKHYNIAIPVMSNRHKEYCKQLADHLYITQPLNIGQTGLLIEKKGEFFAELENYIEKLPNEKIL